ncbi:MAG: class I SAM-dependent methyltransferase [Dehalococcoidia bacterium]
MAINVLSDLDPVARDRSYIRVNEKLVGRVLRFKELYPIRMILDLACGTGLITKLLLQRARALGLEPRVVCLDLDLEALRTARDELDKGHTAMVGGQAQDLPLTGRFDLVLFCNSIHMLERQDKETAVREIHRVLRPGGHLVVNTSYYEGCYPKETKRFYVTWVKKALAILNAKLPNREKGQRVAAMDWLTPEEYRNLLEANGFRIFYLNNRCAKLAQNSFRAISEYRDFAMGALRAVERDSKAASQALKETLGPAFRSSGLRRLSRNWLEIVAQKV